MAPDGIQLVSVPHCDAIRSAPRCDSAKIVKVGFDAPEVGKMLVDAYEASKRDADGYASLGEVGLRASNRSSFDARNYGFSRLSDLFEAVPGFVVDRRDGGALVRRKK